MDKVHLATILGTIQATFTNFRYLRNIWKKNIEEEALLGVSLTGMMDHPVLSVAGEGAATWLKQLRMAAVACNKEYAHKLKINPSTAITCVKPSGTASQLVDSASGLHTRYAQYYIRRVRGDDKDPLTNFLMAKGVPWEEDKVTRNQIVFSFPQKAPEGAVLRNQRSAIEQMEHWKLVQDHWCEHKPSITVSYKPTEFLGLGQWVWDFFDEISGVAFLPYSEHTYQQAPYEEITEEQYNEAVRTFPARIAWEDFEENDDFTIGTQTLACFGSSCEIL
jgi:ribonucleoside-diphosphate reductase alpha chain